MYDCSITLKFSDDAAASRGPSPTALSLYVAGLCDGFVAVVGRQRAP